VDCTSLYTAGSLTTVRKELSKYKLDLVRMKEVKWDRGGTELADEYTFLCGKGLFVHKRTTSAKSVEFVSDVHTFRGR
jgi:hypothetical protein